jgi:hypothetical protein
MWIEDLSPLGDMEHMLAIGWLGRGHTYPVGEVPMAVYKKLTSLLSEPGQPAASGAIQPCVLCVYEPERAGTMSLFVPGDKRVYVAPELILHYMNAHGYQPPEEFCQAVTSCPRMGTPEYRQALLTAGGPGVLRYAAGGGG